MNVNIYVLTRKMGNSMINNHKLLLIGVCIVLTLQYYYRQDESLLNEDREIR
jgi:hypothetical protein